MSDEKYIAALPEGVRDNESLVNAGSTSGLAEMYVNLEQKMGSALFAPGEDADDDQWGKFYGKVNDIAPGLTRIPTDEDEDGWKGVYNKLGRPDEATGYEAPEVKDGDNVLDQSAYLEDFKAHAHQLGLNAKQFSEITKWFGERTVAGNQGAAEARNTAMTALNNEWGDATPARIARVQALITEQGGEGAADAMGDIGNNPVVLKMLDKMADAMMEEGSLENQGHKGDAATRTGIEDEIATLKGNEAYGDRKHQDHQRTVDRVEALYKKLEPYKKVA